MRCFDCKYFIHRREGARGGIHGMCEKSATDRLYWKEYAATRYGCTPACKKFERQENER